MSDVPDSTLDPAAFLRDQVAARIRGRADALRAEIARIQGELDDLTGAEVTIGLVLEGEAGGEWYLNIRGGDATVSTEPERPPLIRVYQTRAEWEALARGGEPASRTDLTRARIMRLGGLEGVIEFRVTDDTAERRVLVHVGSGERAAPRCTISVRTDVARRLRSGDLTPAAAFMQGLVVIHGDVAFAMQVGTALLL